MKYTLEFQTVTETFLSGAEQTVAELRWPAISGCLRFWFRALMGKVIGNNREALLRLEALTFGGTEGAGSFRPRLHADKIKIGEGRPPKFGAGAAYLAFSCLRNNRPWLESGSPFTITLRFDRPDPLLEEVILGSFWLLCHFGGIGSRSRRGWGSIALLSGAAAYGPSFAVGAEPRRHFADNLAQIEEAFARFARRHGVPPDPTPPDVPEFTSFQRWSGRIILRDGWEDIHHLLNDAGRMLRGLRTDLLHGDPDRVRFDGRGGHTDDYDRVLLAYLLGWTVPLNEGYLRNAALGLPLMALSSSRKKDKLWPNEADVGWSDPTSQNDPDKRLTRRASPLFFRPIRLDQRKIPPRFGLLITVFPGQFLPVTDMQLCADGRLPLTLTPPEAGDIQTFAAAFFTRVDYWFGKTYQSHSEVVELP